MAVMEMQERAELAQFRQQDVAIAKLAEEYTGLTINGINDKAGFDKVHKARMTVRNYRVQVEKTRKELKADALEYGRTVDAEAKRLTAALEAIEQPLCEQENAVLAEKERIKKAAEEAKAAIVKARVDALVAAGAMPNPVAVAAYTEESFQAALKTATEAKAERERLAEVERLRLAAEAEERRKEGERLAAERAELDKVRREQEAEAARLKAERDKVEAEAAAQRRAVELEAAKKEAAEKARIETERRLAEEQARKEREAAELAARQKAEAEATEAARLEEEAAKPQRKKLLAIAEIVEAIAVPDGPGAVEVKALLTSCASQVRAIAKGPLRKRKAG